MSDSRLITDVYVIVAPSCGRVLGHPGNQGNLEKEFCFFQSGKIMGI